MKLRLKKPMWAEKRDSVRLELECPASFYAIETKFGFFKKKSAPLDALMVKPSMRGLRLVGKVDVAQGTRIKIHVDMTTLGYDKSYEVLGDVMWSDYSGKTKAYEQGVSLLDSGADAKAWQKFVLAQLKSTDRHSKLHTMQAK
jgi:hypothetical protein